MQLQIQNLLGTVWYFALGSPHKTSLSIQFCLENNFEFLQDPAPERVCQCPGHAIIEGSLELFRQLQALKPELSLLYFGSSPTPQQSALVSEYLSIGRCVRVPDLDYGCLRKALNPNLVFIYGPDPAQNEAAARTLSHNIHYDYLGLPAGPNQLIKGVGRSRNYVINGVFTQADDMRIVEEYFNVRVIHFQYSREDLPKRGEFFDCEHDFLPYLRSKPFYIGVKGDDDPVAIMDCIGVGLCPQLIYINYDSNLHGGYVNEYIQQTSGLLLDIDSILSIRARKNLQQAEPHLSPLQVLNQILYRDLNRREVVLAQFPSHMRDLSEFENNNRKFSHFVDLLGGDSFAYTEEYTNQVYFLENQKRLVPCTDLTLRDELQSRVQYWVVNGPTGAGKTSIARYIASEFGYKLLEFETEAAAAKEKLASPEDGEEVPAIKYAAYFGNILRSNPDKTFVLDSLPYSGNDLAAWLKEVGSPHVINLRIEGPELIKRQRKKAEADLSAQVSEQEVQKAEEAILKNTEWVDYLSGCSPATRIYQVEASAPLLLTQPLVAAILRPRLFLTQSSPSLLYHNIAIKHNLGFINLLQTPLRECEAKARRCGKRNIIIFGYGCRGDALVSEDMYWLEKNVGEIRYLGIWEKEEIETKEALMHLERPAEPVKPKPAEGEDKEEEQAEPEDEEGKPKKVFDIYAHTWTQPGSHKNLSQWYFKLKKKIHQRASPPHDCFNNFASVLATLNSDRSAHFYETIL